MLREARNLTECVCEVGGAKVDVDEQCAFGRGTPEVELLTKLQSGILHIDEDRAMSRDGWGRNAANAIC